MNVKNKIARFDKIDFKIPIKKKQEVVYTTLRLSQTAHEAIKEVSQMQGLKHAEVFASMLSLFEAFEASNDPLQFETVKGKIVTTRKTYVLKREFLDKLRKVLKSRNVNRDLFIERMSLLLKFLVDKQQSDKKKKYPRILKECISPFLRQANDIEKKLCTEVGVDDPITKRFGSIVTILTILEMAIEGNIEKGAPIEAEDISQQ